jgi:hypothetical protein
MTTLTNTEIRNLDEKLRIYNRNFFSVINVADGLLNETTSIQEESSLNIPLTADSTYSIGQFATFIRKIVNFSIKNYDQTLTDTDLCFVKNTGGSPLSNDNNRDHIIKTLKVINVFVDILEAYKYCIESADDTTTPSGYTQTVNIDMIEIVSDKIRFYDAGVMHPSAENRNIGYIRNVSHNGATKKVLFLSIQSFDTGMTTPTNIYNYDELFTKSSGTYATGTNILEPTARSSTSVVSQTTENYKYQRYTDNSTNIPKTGLTLDARNKSLIVLLIRTLFNLEIANRKQSVSALYYYYKFVQLYSTFIIHVSNVMYNDVKLTSDATLSPFRIETYNTTTNKKTHGISAIEKGAKPPHTNTDAVAVEYGITYGGAATIGVAASISSDTATGSSITISVSNAGSGFNEAPSVVISEIVGATKPTATAVIGKKIDRITLSAGTGRDYNPSTKVTVAPANGGRELRPASLTAVVNAAGDITEVTVNDGGVYTGGVPTISFTIGSGKSGTAELATTYSIGTITVSGGSGYKTLPNITFNPAGSGTTAAGTAAVANAALSTSTYTVTDGSISNRGKGYLQNPIITLTPNTYQIARATIVPMVYPYPISNEENIKRLASVISEINETITSLQNDLTKTTYSKSPVLQITTATAGNTGVFKSTDNFVVIKVTKPAIYTSLKDFRAKYDLVKDYIIYDKINKYSYNIISAEDAGTNDFQITIDAVFVETDKANTTQFKKSDNQPITTSPTSQSPTDISYTSEFLELRLKDTNTFKVGYIKTRGELSVLETDINFKSSKVTHQNNLYQSQNNKKIFLERQVLAYNIILAIIVIILVAINVVKVDKEVVKTVSLSCFGVIILLFVIYFISNLTYIETFASVSGELLYDLSFPSFSTVDNGSNSAYTTKKINKLKEVIADLNTRFIGYFEKLIITLPASENYDFYKEISEIIDNDRDNKLFIKDNLDYSKNQNDNNINSIKYELENNKLYINTLLISSVIFIGLYNLYIHYITDDKYLSLLIFVCVIIFVIIISYYYITANRRVKTVFKNIYWGPEFSKRF